MTSIVWFQNDLRLRDNPALRAAAKQGPIVPVFILDEPLGGATGVWLNESLKRLNEELRAMGGSLNFYEGDTLSTINSIISQTGASQIFWNRRYDPKSVERENKVRKELGARDIHCQSFNANLLLEPWDLKNGKGEPYRVFTPYWKAAQKHYQKATRPLSRPTKIEFDKELVTNKLDSFPLLTGKSWERTVLSEWSPGEQGARKLLNELSPTMLKNYQDARDIPSIEGTSRLSAHLHFGEISPKQILHKVGLNRQSEPFVRQLAWREFAVALLYAFPHTIEKPLNPMFSRFRWTNSTNRLQKWQKGMTGYPIVDAGMRQLWQTGWMHNRVRMIVASFLIKDLMIHWKHGAAWFWDTLVDADHANNTLGWQWVAGCGADAAPYFRIFNPVTQSEKFDPKGDYIREWVPELASLDSKQIHAPWKWKTNIKLGTDYPKPIVDHAEARAEALSRYHALRS